MELSAKGLQIFQTLDKMYLIPIYQRAAEKYNIPWEYLAAINYVESTLWTNQNASSVGAIGPMQFMERTWVGWSDQFFHVYPGARTNHSSLGDIHDRYHAEIKKPEVIKRFGGIGVDANGDGVADPFNEEDAIFTAAKLLAQNGMAEGKIDKAIFSYNHSWKYVRDVKQKAIEFTQPVANQPVLSSPSFNPGGWDWPLRDSKGVELTSPFSYGTCVVYRGKERCGHGGVDFGTSTGEPIYPTKSGRVAVVAFQGEGCGWFVTINHGNGIESTYCHMDRKPPVHVNMWVDHTTVIGYVGSTGRSSGPHLHYQVKVNGAVRNPMEFIRVPSDVKTH